MAPSDEEEGNLFQLRSKDATEVAAEEDDYASWLQGEQTNVDEKAKEDLEPLRRYWTSKDLDDKDKFLRVCAFCCAVFAFVCFSVSLQSLCSFERTILKHVSYLAECLLWLADRRTHQGGAQLYCVLYTRAMLCGVQDFITKKKWRTDEDSLPTYDQITYQGVSTLDATVTVTVTDTINSLHVHKLCFSSLLGV